MYLDLVIFVRHGEYDDDIMDGRLDEWGCRQLRALSEKIFALVAGRKTKVLSSTAKRAMESADIIAQKFGVPVSGHEILWSDSSHPWSYPDASHFVVAQNHDEQSSEFKVAVVVTHLEYIRGLPRFFAKTFLNADVESREIPKGCAWVLDCQAKTLTSLSC